MLPANQRQSITHNKDTYMNELPEPVRAALRMLAEVLADIDRYTTVDAWVDDLIIAAERVISAAAPPAMTA